FSSESQCLMNIVTCDRGVGRRTPFKERGCEKAALHQVIRTAKRKIASPIFRLVRLITADASF
ncbi:hypothetical protein, partial [Enterococcus lactis]|uniref:hypothetical protein n=1 Tax=Enterococcus lactis TaxID=357441 RepID=UPI001C7D5B8B